MTIARLHGENLQRTAPYWLLAGLLAFAGTAMAQTSPANARFQQAVRQQQVGDQLQKSQQQAQQRQNVANMQQQPLAQGSAARSQQDQADRAQQDRTNARQQDLVNQYQDAATPPPQLQSTDSSSGKRGH
jgi:hypothetical protein